MALDLTLGASLAAACLFAMWVACVITSSMTRLDVLATSAIDAFAKKEKKQ
jgi:hypothetical protein